MVWTLQRIGFLSALVVTATWAEPTPSPSTADVRVEVRTGPPSAPSLQPSEIFQILRGGSKAPDTDLDDHLWHVAASLAERGWKPPRVSIRMVVEELPEG